MLASSEGEQGMGRNSGYLADGDTSAVQMGGALSEYAPPSSFPGTT